MKRKGTLAAMFLLSGVILTGCATQIEKGTSLLEEKKYEEAAEAFEKASKKSSMEKEAYRGLGISYYELKQFDRAKKRLRRLWKKEPRRLLSFTPCWGLPVWRSDSMRRQLPILRREVKVARWKIR